MSLSNNNCIATRPISVLLLRTFLYIVNNLKRDNHAEVALPSRHWTRDSEFAGLNPSAGSIYPSLNPTPNRFSLTLFSVRWAQ